MQEAVAKEAHKVTNSKDLRPWNMTKGEDAEGYIKQIGERRFSRIFSDFVPCQSSDGLKYKLIKFSNIRAKDRLSALMASGQLGIPTDASKNYHAQMQNEQKKEVSPGRWRWQLTKQHAPNHLWDCEVLQVVAACIVGALNSMQEIKN
jgi:hypothetical protein